MLEDKIIEEEENQAIEYISNKVLESGLDEVVPILLAAMYPLCYILGQFGRVLIEPYTVLLGKHEKSFDKYVSIFEKRKNIRRLMDEIDELSDAKRENEKIRRKEAKKNREGSKISNLWQRLKEFIP